MKILKSILKTPKTTWLFLSSKFQECNFIIKISARENVFNFQKGGGVNTLIMEKNQSNSSDSATPGPSC